MYAQVCAPLGSLMMVSSLSPFPLPDHVLDIRQNVSSTQLFLSFMRQESDMDNLIQNMVSDTNCHPVPEGAEICDLSFSNSLQHRQHQHEQPQMAPDGILPQEYVYAQEDPNGGDYVILSSLSEHTHETHQQQDQPAKQPTYNILDQSVRELFYDEPKPDDDQQQERRHNDNGFQLQGNPEDEDTCDSFSTTYESQNGFSNTNHSDSDNSSKSAKVSPFSEECLIPLPGGFGGGYLGTRTFVRKRNERERARVRSVNDGFERLRAHLPIENEPKDRRLSKVETLRFAIQYIEHLQSLLNDD